MRTYRIYWIKEDGQRERGPAITCRTDEEAIEALKELKLGNLPHELRDGDRVVLRIQED